MSVLWGTELPGSSCRLVRPDAPSHPPRSLLEQFAIYNLEQQNTQRASGANGSKGADLVSYVEQQRDYR